MAKPNRAVVEYIARLASLKFAPKDLELYTKKFTRVLEYVEQLNELDTTGIEPTSHATEECLPALREDSAKEFDAHEAILKNVPARDGRFVKVPKVI